MALSTDELDFILTDLPDSVVVTFGTPTQTTRGALDLNDPRALEQAGLEVIGDDIVLTIRDGALTGLNMDDAITVDGTAYKIRNIGKRLTEGWRLLALVEA